MSDPESPFYCKECNQMFTDKVTYLTHTRQQEDDPSIIIHDETGEGSFPIDSDADLLRRAVRLLNLIFIHDLIISMDGISPCDPRHEAENAVSHDLSGFLDKEEIRPIVIELGASARVG